MDLLGLGDITDLLPFPSSVEQWRPLVTAYAGGIPVDFLLAWIQKESGGDPCSYTSLRESGIFQLMPPDNTNVGGTSEAALRAQCSGGSHSQTRPLTDAEAQLQVQSGIRYINYAIDQAQQKLNAAGVSWPRSSTSFWQMVKLVFNYPGPIVGWLNAATQKLGHPPVDWDEFRGTISGYAGVLDNAEWVGARANPSALGDLTLPLILGGGLAVLWLLSR